MNKPIIASCAYRTESTCIEYGSQGRRIPKPSKPGIGSKFRRRATTSMKPKNERAAQNPKFVDVIQSSWPGTRNGTKTGSAQRSVPEGPAREDNEPQALLAR